MAQINLSFDTKTKKMSIMMDGRELKNVSAAMFYNYYQEEGFRNRDEFS